MYTKIGKRIALVFFLFTLGLIVQAQADVVTLDEKCFSSKWPHERSDLKPDPSVYFGRLANGFRFAIKHNALPQDRVALYLNVRVGSIQEEDEERGYAHFLEHMLFNGSKHFPPGKLVEFFQENGMKFGADSNAYTSHEETVYVLDLPGNNVDKIKRGLLVMSDYAHGALLLESEVRKERGIIQAEKAARNSVFYQIAQEKKRVALSGSRITIREPIGIMETINNANSRNLKAFYDKWYRPDNMVLVVVGNVDTDRLTEEIQSTFSSLQGRGPRGVCRDPGLVYEYGIKPFVYNEPESGFVNVALQSYWNIQQQNDSEALQEKVITRYMASSILQNRLLRSAEDKLMFSRPRLSSGKIIEQIGYSSISASTSSDKWQDTLKEIVTKLKQAKKYGFNEHEKKLAKSEINSFYEKEAITAGNRDSRRIARSIVHSINENKVYQSPEQTLEQYLKIANKITLDDLHREFLEIWKHPNRLIALTGNLGKENTPSPNDLISFYRDKNESKVASYSDEEEVSFPYLHPVGDKVWPVHHRKYDNIGAESYHWANGVVLHMKKTDFEKNELVMTFNFGRGKSSEPSLGTSMLAESVFEGSGTASLSATQMNQVTATNSVNYAFSVGKSSFSLWGKALKKDTKSLFDTLYALYRDPGVKENIFAQKKERYDQMYTAMQADIDGADSLYVDNFLSGNHKLESMPGNEELQEINFLLTKQWLLDSFKRSVPEISVVGDIDTDQLIKMVSRYFGSLPNIEKNEIKHERVDFPHGQVLRLNIPTKVDKALVVFAWETGDLSDIHRVRRLHLLAELIRDRIRLVIREKLGITYSTSVYNKSSRLIPGYGVLQVKITVEPSFVDQVIREMESIVENLRVNGVQGEELIRLKKPLIASLHDRIQTNRYWLFSVLSQMRDYPEQLNWPLSIIDDNKAVNTEEVNDYINTYLSEDKAAKIVIQPAGV